jgi:hypothetical protein
MPRLAALLNRWIVAVLTAPILVYRYAVSPLFPPRCRFFPSCSEYALEALRRHGAARGGLLAIGRICRCHPLNDGGLDPVPQRFAPLGLHPGRWPAALRAAPEASLRAAPQASLRADPPAETD